jgi:hypothetical protein
VGVNDWADAGGGVDVINCASPASSSLWQLAALINKVGIGLSSPSASVGTELVVPIYCEVHAGSHSTP